jgi:hypothetical protein
MGTIAGASFPAMWGRPGVDVPGSSLLSPVSCAQHGLIDGIATAAAGPVKQKTGSSQHLHCVADAGPSRFPL